MEQGTRGQQTAQQVLDLIGSGAPAQAHGLTYQEDLLFLRQVLGRALDDPEHPINTLMVQIRSWGFEDGESLFSRIKKDISI